MDNRKLLVFAGSVLLTAGLAVATVANQGRVSDRDRFAVVSIKVQPPGVRPQRPMAGPVLPGGKYVNHFAALLSLLLFSYPDNTLVDKTVVGLPSWTVPGAGALLYFDIDAEPAPGSNPTFPQMQSMMRNVLIDRFHFKFHMEDRTMRAYLLEVDKGGPRGMKPSAPGDESMYFRQGPFGMLGRGVTMDHVAATIAAVVGQPVLNRTGLSGFYDIDVRASGGLTEGDRQDNAMRGVRALGMKLVSVKTSVAVMVVDRADRPTPNQ